MTSAAVVAWWLAVRLEFAGFLPGVSMKPTKDPYLLCTCARNYTLIAQYWLVLGTDSSIV